MLLLCTVHSIAVSLDFHSDSTSVTQVVATDPTTPEQLAALAAVKAAEAAAYDKLKQDLQLWCMGTAAVCFLACLGFYGKVANPPMLHSDRTLIVIVVAPCSM